MQGAANVIEALEAQIAERDNELAALRERVAELEGKVTAIVGWLEREQPDVFRRGLWDALRRLNDFFRAPAERLVNAERAIKRSLTAYDDEQDRIRREKQRQADEEARQARERAEREAAAAREKAEREARELRAKAEAEAAAGRQAEAAKLAARADAKVERAEGKAEALEQAAAMTVAPVVQAEAPRVRGVATREVWRFAIDDESKIPRKYLVVDDVKIRKVVAALKGDAKIPGVRVWPEKQIAAGAA